MAMHNDLPFVRASADAIGLERLGDDEDEEEDFDRMNSHLIECKCRSGNGWHGSLDLAKRIQRKVARYAGGVECENRTIQRGKAPYLHVSSSEREKLNALIPNASERIQILHHAATYGRNRTTFLVGDPQGKLLFGLIVTFEEGLLADYRAALTYLYDNALEVFYRDSVDDMPLELFEEILVSEDTLKRKYTMDDFMTSLLIARELMPGSHSKVMHPIPPCDMLVPFEYSLWNSSKGGSDTITRLIWNCKAKIPVLTPQTVVVARLLMIYAVLFHRLSQAVTIKKKPDAATDTVQSVRERNNKRIPFHKSLRFLRKRLIQLAKECQTSSTASSGNDASSTAPNFLKENAPRYDPRHEKTRIERNHEVLGKVPSSGATPIGKGKYKKCVANHDNYAQLKNRYVSCRGCIARMFTDDKKKGGFKLSGKTCDLCGLKEVTTFCIDCKRTLCFDKDRSKKIKSRLQGPDRERLLEEYPYLVGLSRGDVPPFYSEIGKVGGNKMIIGKSCYHFAHPTLFCQDTREQDDDQSSSLARLNTPTRLP
jgi:hypothetical protein